MTVPLFKPRQVCQESGCVEEAWRSGLCRGHARSGYERRRTSTSDGVHTNQRKLTDEQVAEAKRMRAAFKTHREIAEHFGVAVSTIQEYLRTGKGRIR